MSTVIRASSLETRLTAAIGEERTGTLISLALGIDKTIRQNPMVSELLGGSLFPALAIIYGTVLQATQESIELAKIMKDARLEREAERTLNEMKLLVELASQPEPISERLSPGTASLLEQLMNQGVSTEDDGA